MWQRGNTYFTDWLPISNLVGYTLSNVLGFIFVNHVTLKRNSYVESQNRDAWDLFATVFVISPLLFYLSVLTTWHSAHSTDLIRCPESL